MSIKPSCDCCDGFMFVIQEIVSQECCGRFLKSGECCGNAIPVVQIIEDYEACQVCRG